jgi:DNA-binding MarR family transcriptional regulator
VTQATISGLINSLEKAGLVTRESHAKDGRAYVIKMTEAGNALIQKISPEYYARVKTFTDEFSLDEKVQLNDLLNRGLKKITALGRSL